MLTGEELGAAIERARKLKGVTKAAIAAHFGVAPPSIQDWVKRGTIDKEKLPALWAYFSDVAGPEHWGLKSASSSPFWNNSSTPSLAGVAHALTLDAITVPPLTIAWEGLMNAPLPPVFRLELIDDSMAPELRLGDLAELDTRLTPRPGDFVLVRDQAGHHYLREYRMSRPGEWQAVARNPAFGVLESTRDGLVVIAVNVGETRKGRRG